MVLCGFSDHQADDFNARDLQVTAGVRRAARDQAADSVNAQRESGEWEVVSGVLRLGANALKLAVNS